MGCFLAGLVLNVLRKSVRWLPATSCTSCVATTVITLPSANAAVQIAANLAAAGQSQPLGATLSAPAAPPAIAPVSDCENAPSTSTSVLPVSAFVPAGVAAALQAKV